jgi:hypothetical protein
VNLDGYRYGFNGQEKSDEVTNGSTTALFWEYDSRIGRRWNIDPKPMDGVSGYNTFGGNPILLNDVLGDTTKGNNGRSAEREVETIQNSFDNNDNKKDLKALFKLDGDHLTLAHINEDKFAKAIEGLDPNEQALAKGYLLAINGPKVHVVEIVTIDEGMSKEANDIFETESFVNGSSLDVSGLVKYGGGVNLPTSTGSYTLLLYENKSRVDDYKSKTGFPNFFRFPSLGERFAHELLGHALGRQFGVFEFNDLYAIQVNNIYLRVHNSDRLFRTGLDHDGLSNKPKKPDGVLNDIPDYINNAPSILQKISVK